MDYGREGVIPLNEKTIKKLKKIINKRIYVSKKPNIFKRIINKFKK